MWILHLKHWNMWLPSWIYHIMTMLLIIQYLEWDQTNMVLKKIKMCFQYMIWVIFQMIDLCTFSGQKWLKHYPSIRRPTPCWLSTPTSHPQWVPAQPWNVLWSAWLKPTGVNISFIMMEKKCLWAASYCCESSWWTKLYLGKWYC